MTTKEQQDQQEEEIVNMSAEDRRATNDATEIDLLKYRQYLYVDEGEEKETYLPILTITNTEVINRFKKIDYSKSKMTALDNDIDIWVYAVRVMKTTFGDMLYILDYDLNIYQTNKSTTTRFVNEIITSDNIFAGMTTKKDVSISKGDPLMRITITGDATYKGHSYKQFDAVFYESNMFKRY